MICVGGLGALVKSDLNTGKNWEAASKGKGDAFMIAGATLYGFSMCIACPIVPSLIFFIANATEEFLVRKRPLYEVRTLTASHVCSQPGIGCRAAWDVWFHHQWHSSLGFGT